MKAGNVQVRPLQPSALTPPVSPRLEALREQRQHIGTRRELLQQELQTTFATIRELHDDLNTRGNAAYEQAMAHRRDIETELEVLTDQKASLRRQTAEELEELGQPIKRALFAEYVAHLGAYADALQAALTAQAKVQAVVAKGQHGLPGLHNDDAFLRRHAAAVAKWLAQEDRRYA